MSPEDATVDMFNLLLGKSDRAAAFYLTELRASLIFKFGASVDHLATHFAYTPRLV
jgi:hypothetical protein